MAEYIEREAAIKALMNDAPEQVGYSREDTADCIRYIPAADVAPVRHGRWLNWRRDPIKPGESWSGFRCERCKNVIVFDEPVSTDDFPSNFCPNCGSRMDGGTTNAQT